MVKILHISSARVDYPGGTEKVLWELAKRQAKTNKVTILQTNLYQENEKYDKEEDREGVKVITCQNNSFMGGFGYSPEFKEKLKEIWKNFDIIHIHGHGRFTSNFSMGFLKNKKPFIYSAQGFFHDKKNSFFKRTYNFIFGRRLRNASFCTALTKLEEEKLIDFRVDRDKIKVIPGGIDLKKFKVKINMKKLREEYLGKRKNKKTMLYVGRIHESKGIQHVLDAIKDLDINFLIVGRDAGYKDILNNKIKELKIEDKVKFLEGISDEELIKIYKISDFFVLFSDWEGFGLVIIEAMAAGLPAVVSNKGALPTLVKEDYNGFIANNEKELKEKINKMIKNKELRGKMSKNSINFASKFDWDKINKQHEELYRKAIISWRRNEK